MLIPVNVILRPSVVTGPTGSPVLGGMVGAPLAAVGINVSVVAFDGSADGIPDGITEGSKDGAADGISDSIIDGISDGPGEGTPVGAVVTGTTEAVTFSTVAPGVGEEEGGIGGSVGGRLGTTKPVLPSGFCTTVIVGAGVVGASLVGAIDGISVTFATEVIPVPPAVGLGVVGEDSGIFNLIPKSILVTASPLPTAKHAD
jgi:hypothetical protein